MKSVAVLGLLTQAAALTIPSVTGRGENIVGGQDGTIQQFPYQANFNKNNSPHCGGTILDKRTILTAAHCTYGLTASAMSIRVGATDLNEGDRYQVEKFIQHPKYNAQATDYDVSILKLSKDLIFNDSVQPIGSITNSEAATGTLITVSGWGATSEGVYGTTTLQYVDVPIVDHDECNKDYNGAITSRMICAAFPEGGKDSCQGDSGGPFVKDGTIYGIVSWGEGCARAGLPGIYTNIANSEIRSFIKTNAGL
ncbi:hypothetical protein VHEMI06393 [[Torrubiella] hemipterigena]|uniref:Peptidase S1 domain-containing protein n=1 Tax=[Torrubiella] hemipterigena TaxID=1531966 RepID=A0A0A1TJ15_9HYPO|nr:hypothetical protein VHEMI06393 [[Torrubiella] hemipterigena]